VGISGGDGRGWADCRHRDIILLGQRYHHGAVLRGDCLAGALFLTAFIPGGFLGMTLFFASGMNWPVTLLGFWPATAWG
jgi:hypothetical protein